jgi:hypothetical protein
MCMKDISRELLQAFVARKAKVLSAKSVRNLTCGHLMPTPAGQAKVDRNVEMGIRLFLGQLH